MLPRSVTVPKNPINRGFATLVTYALILRSRWKSVPFSDNESAIAAKERRLRAKQTAPTVRPTPYHFPPRNLFFMKPHTLAIREVRSRFLPQIVFKPAHAVLYALFSSFRP